MIQVKASESKPASSIFSSIRFCKMVLCPASGTGGFALTGVSHGFAGVAAGGAVLLLLLLLARKLAFGRALESSRKQKKATLTHRDQDPHSC